jgi:fructose-bisphosphate aldolase/6-deoxy-5-ketofructose 1-phosphate synthase
MTERQILRIPLDVPPKAQAAYKENFRRITMGSGRLMLFAGDQKAGHLNDNFSGPGIHSDDGDPEHLFRIASEGRIGVFATRMGLLSWYGEDYSQIPYLVNLNGSASLFGKGDPDPLSTAWYSVDEVVAFRKQSDLQIYGVGYTVYPGSAHEHTMLREAAQVVRQAHEHGLVTVIWVYPRGAGVKDEKDPRLIAGACGIAAYLGSDFVTVNTPYKEGTTSALLLKEAVRAAGRTRVVCAGGSASDPSSFLTELHEQIHIGGAAGNATGRIIHRQSLSDAVRLCNAISTLVFDNADPQTAIAMVKGKKPSAVKG